MTSLEVESKGSIGIMTTRIHTTKKLEKLIKKQIVSDGQLEDGLLGKWNATVFYVNRKKCLLFINSLTKYNVVIPDISADEFKDLEKLFKMEFFHQLIYDGLPLDFESVDQLIGELIFLKTDNDRSTTGHQNQRLYELSIWHEQYEKFQFMPFRDLTNRMNNIPIPFKSEQNKTFYALPVNQLQKLISSIQS